MHTTRELIRAACKIHAALTTIPPPDIDIGRHYWAVLQGDRNSFDRAQGAGFKLAQKEQARIMLIHSAALRGLLEKMETELKRVTEPSIQATPHDLYKDLLALRDEFEKLEINFKEKTVACTTDCITLADIELGRFKIVLYWNRPKTGSNCFYNIEALEPNCAAGYEHVTHPNVSSETLCEGEGTIPIRLALREGRLLDFFMLVRSILTTDAPGRAYVELANWNDEETDDSFCCDECWDEYYEDSGGWCSRCDASLCSGCVHVCCMCREDFCSKHISNCQDCNRACCPECLQICPVCKHSHFCHFCNDRLTLCQDCEKNVCKDCLLYCRECDKEICITCNHNGAAALCRTCHEKQS